MAKVIQLKSSEWYQLKISLNNVKPLIWRRFVVNSDIKLPDLHKVIQTVMGWTNSHLHQFVADKKFYCEPDPDSATEYTDYIKVKLNQILAKENQSIIYEYDFGDGWEHEIVLEKILPEHIKKHPYCTEGEKSCPPEDCGGPFGYEDLLGILSNPDDDEYKEMIEWLGDDFDPEYFDIEEINDMLKDRDYGCIAFD